MDNISDKIKIQTDDTNTKRFFVLIDNFPPVMLDITDYDGRWVRYPRGCEAQASCVGLIEKKLIEDYDYSPFELDASTFVIQEL